jgi:hypothetical protein
MFEQLKQETATLNYKKQAKIVRNGEPLNRIVIVVDGVQFELDGSLGNLCLSCGYQVLSPISSNMPYFSIAYQYRDRSASRVEQ